MRVFPNQVWMGGVPQPGPDGGIPSPGADGGTPAYTTPSQGWGTPFHTWTGGTPARSTWGYPEYNVPWGMLTCLVMVWKFPCKNITLHPVKKISSFLPDSAVTMIIIPWLHTTSANMNPEEMQMSSLNVPLFNAVVTAKMWPSSCSVL